MEGDDIYPDKVCNSCYISMTKTGRYLPLSISIAGFPMHCLLGCSHEAVGGRPKKRVLTGRPRR